MSQCSTLMTLVKAFFAQLFYFPPSLLYQSLFYFFQHCSNFIITPFLVIWKIFLKNIFTSSNTSLAMLENNHKRCSIDNQDRTNENRHYLSFHKTKYSVAK